MRRDFACAQMDTPPRRQVDDRLRRRTSEGRSADVPTPPTSKPDGVHGSLLTRSTGASR